MESTLVPNAPIGPTIEAMFVQRFIALMQRIGFASGSQIDNVAALADVARALLTAYQEPHRHYHGAAHLQSCLTTLDAVRAQTSVAADYGANALDIIECALCFHDAVYQPTEHDNERRSADWAVAVLNAHLTPASDLATHVYRLIMATQHHGGAQDNQTALLLDIDLSILSADAALFDAYDLGIRAEYHFVPELDYLRARAAILQRFLDAPQIYQTPFFADKNQAARGNLQRALTNMQRN